MVVVMATEWERSRAGRAGKRPLTVCHVSLFVVMCFHVCFMCFLADVHMEGMATEWERNRGGRAGKGL